MTPSNVLLDAIAVRVAADAGTLAPAVNANHLHLAQNAFAEGPNLVIGDFTEATFDGYAPIDVGVGAQQEFVDPTTGLRTIQLLEPAGGWHFETTGATNLPQTIFGAYLTDNTDAIVYGCLRLGVSVELLGTNQAVDIGNLRFAMSATAFT